ncbi:LytTR family transcriptional regulator DNA-binding domain-containing protein [Flagellimonas sp. 2504JD4-2]
MDKNDLSFYDTSKYKLVLSVVTCIFFYGFIIFFLPFGVDNYNPNHEYTSEFLLEMFYFFIPLFLFLLGNEFGLRPLFFKQATIKKVIGWSIWTMVLLASVMFFTYNYLGNWHDFLLKSYFGFLRDVSVVLLFPIVGTFFFFRYRSLQNQMEHILTNKEDYVDAGQLIEFKGVGSKDQITLSASSFLYGKAQDNYVELIYLEQDQLKKFLMRSPLGNLVSSINNTAIVRSHRSYMVNLLHVKSIKGGNQDLMLYLDPFDAAVPVSKSFKSTVLENLRSLKNFG